MRAKCKSQCMLRECQQQMLTSIVWKKIITIIIYSCNCPGNRECTAVNFFHQNKCMKSFPGTFQLCIHFKLFWISATKIWRLDCLVKELSLVATVLTHSALPLCIVFFSYSSFQNSKASAESRTSVSVVLGLNTCLGFMQNNWFWEYCELWLSYLQILWATAVNFCLSTSISISVSVILNFLDKVAIVFWLCNWPSLRATK